MESENKHSKVSYFISKLCSSQTCGTYASQQACTGGGQDGCKEVQEEALAIVQESNEHHRIG